MDSSSQEIENEYTITVDYDGDLLVFKQTEGQIEYHNQGLFKDLRDDINILKSCFIK